MAQTLITTEYHRCSDHPLSYLAVEEDDDGNIYLDWSEIEDFEEVDAPVLNGATLAPSEARALASALVHYAELSPRSD